jgi:hypothetical protein
MLLQVMKNDHVVVVCAHCHLGLQTELVFCITLYVVVVVVVGGGGGGGGVLYVDCCVTMGNGAALV